MQIYWHEELKDQNVTKFENPNTQNKLKRAKSRKYILTVPFNHVNLLSLAAVDKWQKLLDF